MVNEVVKKIEAQQKSLDEFSPAYQVGEQLKDICRSCPRAGRFDSEGSGQPRNVHCKSREKNKRICRQA